MNYYQIEFLKTGWEEPTWDPHYTHCVEAAIETLAIEEWAKDRHESLEHTSGMGCVAIRKHGSQSYSKYDYRFYVVSKVDVHYRFVGAVL